MAEPETHTLAADALAADALAADALAAEFAEALAIADLADQADRQAAADRRPAARSGKATAGLDARTAKILRKQLLMANSTADGFSPTALAYADDADPTLWVVLVAGLEGPAAGGEFLFTLQAPGDFPANPPSVKCHTPNGVFDLDCRICVSIGEFHKEAWRPALGMAGFAREIATTVETVGEVASGIGIRPPGMRTAAVRRTYALASVDANATRARTRGGIIAAALAWFESRAADPDWLPDSTAARALRRRLGLAPK
jgi:ubiquitin-protein ligase